MIVFNPFYLFQNSVVENKTLYIFRIHSHPHLLKYDTFLRMLSTSIKMLTFTFVWIAFSPLLIALLFSRARVTSSAWPRLWASSFTSLYTTTTLSCTCWPSRPLRPVTMYRYHYGRREEIEIVQLNFRTKQCIIFPKNRLYFPSINTAFK